MGGALSAIGNVVSSIPVVGGLIGGNQAPASQQVNQVNPNMSQLQQSLVTNAGNFQTNLPAYEQQQNNVSSDQAKQSLAQGIQASNTAANSRGMLYGGYAQNQANNVTAQNQSNLNTTIANNNSNAQNTASNMASQAIGSGAQLQQQNQNYNNQVYNTALQQQQNKASGFAGLLSGVAGAAGA